MVQTLILMTWSEIEFVSLTEKMLQPGAFCEHMMQQNATATVAPPWRSLGELTSHSGRLLGVLRQMGEKERKGKGKRETRRDEERGGEIDCIWNGYRLTKTHPAFHGVLDTCWCRNLNS